MALFGGNEQPRSARQMQQRNADLQERLYHDISEGILNRGGPDYAGPVDYFPDIPIQSPLQQVGQTVGAALGLSDRSGTIRDWYQNMLLGGGLGGLLTGLGFNTNYQSFGGLPGFFSGAGGMPVQQPVSTTPTMGIPGGANMLTGGRQPVVADTRQRGPENNTLSTIEPALTAQNPDYAQDPYFQGTQAMQNLRNQQQAQAQGVGNQLLGLVGLAQQPEVGFQGILGQVGGLLNQYDPTMFRQGQELLTGATPLRLRQARQRVQEYAPLLGTPMAQQLPGGAGAGQGGSTLNDILALGSLGYGLADEFGLVDAARNYFNAPEAPSAPGQTYTPGGGFNWNTPGVGAGGQGSNLFGNAAAGAGAGMAIGGPWGAAIGGGLGLLGGLA